MLWSINSFVNSQKYKYVHKDDSYMTWGEKSVTKPFFFPQDFALH